MLKHLYFRFSIIKFILPFILYAFIFSSCQKSGNEQNFEKEKYLAHLKLQSSTLIITEVIGDLEIPWEILIGPDGWIWFTEQKGTVSRIHPVDGEKKILLQIPDIHYVKSRGLLGMAVHPDLENNPYVYLHYTFAFETADKLEAIQSRLVRYTYTGDTLTHVKILLDSIPGKTFHNGSRLIITDDNKLMFSMGDIGETALSQNIDYLSGKILRYNLDGSIPDDNPFSGNPVWAWGFRNPQGLIMASNGILYSSDHGPANDDEVNLIVKGRNYGWPDVAGFCDKEQEKHYCQDSIIMEPLMSWSPTVAGAGLEYYAHTDIPEWHNSLIYVNLKGRAMRVLKLNEKGNEISNEHIYLQKTFGRLRDVAVAPNGDIYIATSNLDWHPKLQPFMYDSLPTGGDRIIRIQKATPSMIAQLELIPNPLLLSENLEPLELFDENFNFKPSENHLAEGQKLFMANCATCHRPDGEGVKDLIPPLSETDWVTGDKGRLIQLMLNGLSDPIVVRGVRYEQEMPPFSHLSDEQISHILTFIRQSFGNKAGAVIAGEVSEERKRMR